MPIVSDFLIFVERETRQGCGNTPFVSRFLRKIWGDAKALNITGGLTFFVIVLMCYKKTTLSEELSCESPTMRPFHSRLCFFRSEFSVSIS